MKVLFIFLFLLFVSCSAERFVTSKGRTFVFVNDTTVIEHSGNYNLKIK